MDTYKEILIILKSLLIKSDNSHWAKWIQKDIDEWESNKSTKHHLSAYGGMGSINDLWIGTQSIDGIWADNIWERCKSLAYLLARNGGIGGLELLDQKVASHKKEIQGSRCLECGYGHVTELGIEDYVASHLLLTFLTELSTEQRLTDILIIQQLREDPRTIKLRSVIQYAISESEISLTNKPNWHISTCPECNSSNMAVYRWRFELGESEPSIFPSNNNLKVKAKK